MGALIRALGEVAQAIPPALTTVASDGPRDMTQSEIRGAARLYAAELECVLDGSKRGSQLRARFSELVSAGVRFHLRRLLNPVPPPLTTPPAVRAVGAGSEPGPHDRAARRCTSSCALPPRSRAPGAPPRTARTTSRTAAADGALAVSSRLPGRCATNSRTARGPRRARDDDPRRHAADDSPGRTRRSTRPAPRHSARVSDGAAAAVRGARGLRGRDGRVARCRLGSRGVFATLPLARAIAGSTIINTEAGGWAPLERYAAHALSHRLEDESHFAALADIAKLRETLALTEPRTDARRRTALSELTRIARAFGGRTASNATTPAASSCGAADVMVTRRDVVAAARDAQRRAMLFPDLAPAEKASPSAGVASPRRSPDTDM